MGRLRRTQGTVRPGPYARGPLEGEPPDPIPFRADPTSPGGSRRSSWVSTIVVLGCVAAVIVLLGWAQMRSSY